MREAPVRETRHSGVWRVKRAGKLKEVLRLAQDAVIRALHAHGAAAVRREEPIAPPVASNETTGRQRRVEVDAAIVECGQREKHCASGVAGVEEVDPAGPLRRSRAVVRLRFGLVCSGTQLHLVCFVAIMN